jgi:hypothetical protein
MHRKSNESTASKDLSAYVLRREYYQEMEREILRSRLIETRKHRLKPGPHILMKTYLESAF